MRINSDLAGQIRQSVTTRQVAETYGFTPNHAGFIPCPFHTGDHTASLKLFPDGGWKCFGCGKGGSVIDFAMCLFNITFRQACLRLDTDFHLGLSGQKADHKAYSESIALRKAEAREKQRLEAEQIALAQEHRYWWEIKQVFIPADGYVHPLYAEAIKKLPYLQYRLDEYNERVCR